MASKTKWHYQRRSQHWGTHHSDSHSLVETVANEIARGMVERGEAKPGEEVWLNLWTGDMDRPVAVTGAWKP